LPLHYIVLLCAEYAGHQTNGVLSYTTVSRISEPTHIAVQCS